MKVIAKSVTNEEVSIAVEELHESIRKVVAAMSHAVKNIDWENMAPKMIMGLMLVYGLRNRKVLSTIISSIIIGMITKRVSATDHQP